LEVLNSLFQEAEHAHINLFCVMVIGRRVLAVQRFRDSGEVRVVVGFELYYSPRMGKSEFASLKVNTLEPSRWRRNEIRRVPLTQFNPCRSLSEPRGIQDVFPLAFSLYWPALSQIFADFADIQLENPDKCYVVPVLTESLEIDHENLQSHKPRMQPWISKINSGNEDIYNQGNWDSH